MHGINIVLGQSVGETLPQIGQAFLHGLLFYILRRVTGSLIWAMALHGAWDFSVFSLGATDGSNPLAITSSLLVRRRIRATTTTTTPRRSAAVALVTFWFAARDARKGSVNASPHPRPGPGLLAYAGHGDAQPLLGVDEVVVVVGADIQLAPSGSSP